MKRAHHIYQKKCPDQDCEQSLPTHYKLMEQALLEHQIHIAKNPDADDD